MTEEKWKHLGTAGAGALDIMLEEITFITLGNGVMISGKLEEVKEHFRFHLARKMEEGSVVGVTDASDDIRPYLAEIRQTLSEISGDTLLWDFS